MCLLLSLGEYLETPFRILDEFDVFLDPQARKLTMQLLVHTAKKMEHRQFIFITPQDLGSLRPDDKLKIFKLNPPVSLVAQRRAKSRRNLLLISSCLIILGKEQYRRWSYSANAQLFAANVDPKLGTNLPYLTWLIHYLSHDYL